MFSRAPGMTFHAASQDSPFVRLFNSSCNLSAHPQQAATRIGAALTVQLVCLAGVLRRSEKRL